MQEKFARGEYKHPKEFKHDVNLVWHNCMTYNVVSSLFLLASLFVFLLRRSVFACFARGFSSASCRLALSL